MATLEEVAVILGGLAPLYPRYELLDATIKAYHRILSDLPGNLLDRAGLQLASTNTFFPAAAELRQATFDLMDRIDGVLTAEEAWVALEQAMGDPAKYDELRARCPLIHEIVQTMGGTRELGLSQNWMAERAHFLKIYGVMSQRDREQRRMLPEVRDVLKQVGDGMRPQLPDGGRE